MPACASARVSRARGGGRVAAAPRLRGPDGRHRCAGLTMRSTLCSRHTPSVRRLYALLSATIPRTPSQGQGQTPASATGVSTLSLRLPSDTEAQGDVAIPAHAKTEEHLCGRHARLCSARRQDEALLASAVRVLIGPQNTDQFGSISGSESMLLRITCRYLKVADRRMTTAITLILAQAFVSGATSLVHQLVRHRGVHRCPFPERARPRRVFILARSFC